MKKLLSILSSLALTAVGATTVVSCTVPKTNIDVNFKDSKSNTFSYDTDSKKYTFKDNGGDAVYTADQLDTAMNGNFAMMNQQFPVAMSFDQLNQGLLNLISFNQSLVVKTQKDMQQLRDFRDTFLGRDSNTVNSDKGIDTASVDGIKFRNIDDNNYYGAFQKTSINSLTGLLDLYNYVNDSKNDVKVLGASASATVKEAQALFDDKNSAASKLMKNFANSKKNPAFTKITYDLPLTVYHSQSQIIDGFASNTEAKDGNQLHVGSVQSYKDNNVNVSEETTANVKKNKKGNETGGEIKDSKLITDHANTDPYSAIIAKPDETNFANNQIDSGLTFLTETTRQKGDASDSVLREYFTKDSNNSPVYYYVDKDGKGNSTINQNIGEYMVKKIPSFNVSYQYETDMEHNKTKAKADSTTYNINFKLNNLAEVFSPYMTAVNGTTLTTATKNKDSITLKFSKKITSDDVDGLKASTGTVKINDDGTATVSGVTDKTVITFSDKDKKNGVSKTPLTYNIDFGKKSSVDFTTSQLVWVFRGYKFLDDANLTANEQLGTKFVDQQVSNKKKTGAPERTGDLLADITHHMRDMNLSDWKIETAKDSSK